MNLESDETLEAEILRGFAVDALNDIKAELLKKLWADFRALVAQKYPEWAVTATFDRSEASKWRGLEVCVAAGDAYKIYLEF